ncbi:hypothetical protein LX32DRAFT_645474, partial [Colletotrichum zoysiae]
MANRRLHKTVCSAAASRAVAIRPGLSLGNSAQIPSTQSAGRYAGVLYWAFGLILDTLRGGRSIPLLCLLVVGVLALHYTLYLLVG